MIENVGRSCIFMASQLSIGLKELTFSLLYDHACVLKCENVQHFVHASAAETNAFFCFLASVFVLSPFSNSSAGRFR